MILLTQISRYSANKRISAPENLTPALFTIIVFMMNLCYKRVFLPIRFMGRLETAGRYPGLRTRADSFPSPATFLSVHGRKGGRPCTESTDKVVDVKCLAISSIVAKSRIVFTHLFSLVPARRVLKSVSLYIHFYGHSDTCPMSADRSVPFVGI